MSKDDIYILRGAAHALRSYQYGNSAPALAEAFADRLDAMCERFIAELTADRPSPDENEFLLAGKRADA